MNFSKNALDFVIEILRNGKYGRTHIQKRIELFRKDKITEGWECILKYDRGDIVIGDHMRMWIFDDFKIRITYDGILTKYVELDGDYYLELIKKYDDTLRQMDCINFR